MEKNWQQIMTWTDGKLFVIFIPLSTNVCMFYCSNINAFDHEVLHLSPPEFYVDRIVTLLPL